MADLNGWVIAAIVLLGALVPLGVVVVRAPALEKLVAVEAAGNVSVLVLLLLAVGFARPSMCDLALALAVLGFPAALVFTYFFERWL